jgi:hypothetical protein
MSYQLEWMTLRRKEERFLMTERPRQPQQERTLKREEARRNRLRSPRRLKPLSNFKMRSSLPLLKRDNNFQ